MPDLSAVFVPRATAQSPAATVSTSTPPLTPTPSTPTLPPTPGITPTKNGAKFPDPTASRVTPTSPPPPHSGDAHHKKKLVPPSQKKRKRGLIIGGLILLLLVVGGGASFWLVKRSQDIRQQASEETYCTVAEAGQAKCVGEVEYTCQSEEWVSKGKTDFCSGGTGGGGKVLQKPMPGGTNCGNGDCEASIGENGTNCPQDCSTVDTVADGFCPVDGADKAISCSDPDCGYEQGCVSDTSGDVGIEANTSCANYDENQTACVGYRKLSCQYGQWKDIGSCGVSQDNTKNCLGGLLWKDGQCVAPGIGGDGIRCGDNICDASEENSCPQDCDIGLAYTVGDGKCEVNKGENSGVSPADCGGGSNTKNCPDGQLWVSGKCKDVSITVLDDCDNEGQTACVGYDKLTCSGGKWELTHPGGCNGDPISYTCPSSGDDPSKTLRTIISGQYVCVDPTTTSCDPNGPSMKCDGTAEYNCLNEEWVLVGADTAKCNPTGHGYDGGCGDTICAYGEDANSCPTDCGYGNNNCGWLYYCEGQSPDEALQGCPTSPNDPGLSATWIKDWTDTDSFNFNPPTCGSWQFDYTKGCEGSDRFYTSSSRGNYWFKSGNNWDASCETGTGGGGGGGGGASYACNSSCDSDTQCQSANADYVCSNGSCRLSSNPSSSTCEAKPGEYACNSSCDNDAQCQTADTDYICSNGACRLESNPSNESCQPSLTYTCDSNCNNDTQCQTANANYVCSSGSCRLSSNPSSEACQPPETPTYECNSSCENDVQCQTANADYVCSSGSCRLSSNPSSSTCEVKPGEYACNSSCSSNSQCTTVNSNYVCYDGKCRLDENLTATSCQPEGTTEENLYCNDSCTANADCDNPAHICYNSQCRLATNPSSATCSTPTTVGSQPTLPATLPSTGSEDIINWLKAGLGVLGIGTILLLLL